MKSDPRSSRRAPTGQAGRVEPLEARIAPATFAVTSLADAGQGSLRAALEESNATPGADAIVFAAGVRGAIRLADDLPAITDDLTISGPGAGKLAIDGARHAIFSIDGTGGAIDVSISKLTLTRGQSYEGGALLVSNPEGQVIVTKTVISGNRSVGGVGGGIAVVDGSLNLVQSKVSGNKAGSIEEFYNSATKQYETRFMLGGTGGGIHVGPDANLTVEGSKITRNKAQYGGGIHSSGEVILTAQSKVAKNIAKGGTESEGRGGGIDNAGGALSVNLSKITGNIAQGGKGAAGYYASDEGTPGGAGIGGGVANSSGGSATITSSVVASNMAIGGKGGRGVYGGLGEGGGLFNGADSNLTVVSSVISGNTAQGGNGGKGATGIQGYYSGDPGGRGGRGGEGGDAYGGGIASDGLLVVQSSKVKANFSVGGAGGPGGTGGQGASGDPPGSGGHGGAGGKGGLGTSGGISASAADTTVVNSKVTGNFEVRGRTGSPGGLGPAGSISPGGGGGYYG